MATERFASCALEGPELTERAAEWRRIIALATSRRVINGRIALTYPRDPKLLSTIRGLVVAEAECCPHLHFQVEERAENAFELSVPAEMRDILAPTIPFRSQSDDVAHSWIDAP